MELIEIYAARQSGSVKRNRVRSGSHLSEKHGGDLLPEKIQDIQWDKAVIGEREPDRGRRIERVGKVLEEFKCRRERRFRDRVEPQRDASSCGGIGAGRVALNRPLTGPFKPDAPPPADQELGLRTRSANFPAQGERVLGGFQYNREVDRLQVIRVYDIHEGSG